VEPLKRFRATGPGDLTPPSLLAELMWTAVSGIIDI